jgi:hypothetical protein
VTKERLTRVTSESQLRPGLLMEIRACQSCHQTRCRMLLLSVKDKEHFHAIPLEWCNHTSWNIGGCNVTSSCLVYAIRESRLFIVNPFTDESLTTQRTLERVE